MTSDNASKTIFVTGGTGFIGYTIVSQLLKAGYHVKAAARTAKVDLLKKALSSQFAVEKFEVLDIPDIFTADLSTSLKGVYGFIHVAAPIPGRADAETIYRIAETGCRHIAEEALKAGVRKFVATSSLVTWPWGGPYGTNDWNPSTKEEANGRSFESYVVGKKIEDETFLKFGEEHPDVDISLIAPGGTYGPFAPGFEHLFPEPNYSGFSTNEYIYRLLDPNNAHWAIELMNGVIDVRDISRAHILALEAPPSSVVGRKRFPIVSPDQCSYKTAIEIIGKERPKLGERLANPEDAPVWKSYSLPTNREEIEKAIGFVGDSCIPWKETVLDTVDSLVFMEEWWRKKGFEVAIPDTPSLST